MDKNREREIQNMAEFLHSNLRTMHKPADAGAAMGMVHCALLWPHTQDEQHLRNSLAAYAEGVVELWKHQRETQGVGETRQ